MPEANTAATGAPVAQLITDYITGLPDWRGARMLELRTLIHDVDPQISEEWKWNTPVFSHRGMVCALAAFKDHVKLNFFKGATLPDPKHLFNAGLEAKATRAIDFHAGDPIDEVGLRDLLHAAVAQNVAGGKASKA